MPKLWGSDNQGSKVFIHTLQNDQGTEVNISNYGAIIKDLRVNSPIFGPVNTVLSYPRLEMYLNDEHYLGAVVGRYANRIANSTFNLNGQSYSLPANNNCHHLHGGPKGFYKRTWDIVDANEKAITLKLVSNEGDQGYPGTLEVIAKYILNDDNSLLFQWEASSDEDTYVSLTNHSYFNLAGYGDIRNHYLRIPCAFYTPTDEEGIPHGEVKPVKNTVFDFHSKMHLKHILAELNDELEPFGGIDHNWATGESPQHRRDNFLAELTCPDSGIKLEIFSSLPGMQCYTGNHLAKTGVFGCFEGICLETQYYPDSPNKPKFPQALLKANTTMSHETRFKFTTTDNVNNRIAS